MEAALLVLIVLPLAGAVAVGALSRAEGRLLGGAIAAIVIVTTALVATDASAELRLPWLTAVDIAFHLRLDGIALPFVVLVALLIPAWMIADRDSTSWLLAVEGLTLACFLDVDPGGFAISAILLGVALLAKRGVGWPGLEVAPVAASALVLGAALGPGLLLYGGLRFGIPAFPVELMAAREWTAVLSVPLLVMGIVGAAMGRRGPTFLLAWSAVQVGALALVVLGLEAHGLEVAVLAALAHAWIGGALWLQLRCTPPGRILDRAGWVATLVLAILAPPALLVAAGGLGRIRDAHPGVAGLAVIACVAIGLRGLAQMVATTRSPLGATAPSARYRIRYRVATVALLIPTVLGLIPELPGRERLHAALVVLEGDLREAHRDHVLEPIERARARSSGGAGDASREAP